MFDKAFVSQWLRVGKKIPNDAAEWHQHYFTLWVPFNYFYDFESSRGWERKRIKRFGKKFLRRIQNERTKNPDVMRSFDALSKYSIISMRNFSRTHKEFSVHQNSDIEEVFDYLYTVRCNLFHGSKGFLDKDKEVLKHSSIVLRYYLESLLKDESLFQQTNSGKRKVK